MSLSFGYFSPNAISNIYRITESLFTEFIPSFNAILVFYPYGNMYFEKRFYFETTFISRFIYLLLWLTSKINTNTWQLTKQY